jgi:O-antigen ligase
MPITTRDKICFYSLLAFVFTVPISETVSIRLLILTVVLDLALNRNPHWRYHLLRDGWDLLLFFGVLVFGLLYTDNLETGLGVIEKSLSFIILPFLFSRQKYRGKKMLLIVLSTFAAGVFFASVGCLGYAVYRDAILHDPTGYYYDQFTAVIDSHPTYMAYYVCFSIIFLLYLITFEITGRGIKALILIVILFLLSALMLTGGRTTFVSLFMMASFFFLRLLFDDSPLKAKIQGTLITVVMMSIILLQSPFAHSVLPSVFQARAASPGQIKGDSWERMVLWKSAIQASSSTIAGVGTGDYNDVMRDYYTTHNLPQFAEMNFNAHNQFIQVWFTNGLLGVAALLIILFRPMLLAVRRQNIIGMLTFFPFLIYGISEVFLGRYQGIVFFILLHQLFLMYLHHKPEAAQPRG